MAIKTFTDAVALPASDINTYLTNSAWVYVNSATFTPTTALQVNSVFTSTYTNYKVVFENIVSSTGNPSANLQLTASGTPSTASYSHGSQYWTFQGTPTSFPFGDLNSSQWSTMLFNTTPASSVEYTMYGPAVALATNMTYAGIMYTNTYRAGGGIHNVATAYDGFRLNAANSISGTWSVYGQRKA
jgi:hypothetical protein